MVFLLVNSTASEEASIGNGHKGLASHLAQERNQLVDLKRCFENAPGRNVGVFNGQNNLNLGQQNLDMTILGYNQARVDWVDGLGLAFVYTSAGRIL